MTSDARQTAVPWPFHDAENTAVFSLARVFEGGAPILIVVHDLDGDWQFFDDGPVSEAEAFVVALHEMVVHDPTLVQVACLPRGWRALRNSIGAAWRAEEI